MSEKVFRNFQEFHKLTRPLNNIQRFQLIEFLSVKERDSLLSIIQKEGWQDVWIRNDIDFLTDQIKSDFDEDLILLRIEILSGKVKRVGKPFWNYVKDVFSQYSEECIFHLFGGISVIDNGGDYLLLISSDTFLSE